MEASFESNEVLNRLPVHLLDLVIDQPYNEYTAQDHAVWRYVMRQNVNFLGRVAHKSYLDGLVKTGISIDSIPHMYGMNRILREIGWAAVAVDGFIPPQAFMEFQAYNVLVIAADIRNINHIRYTPAPDILHEAAGHAPIIADQEYARYLKLFGEIGSRAFSSKKDYELYELIRHLSIIKEDPHTPESEILKAEKDIEDLQGAMGEPSEMALIRNLHWWTVEYGLIGTTDDFKIYGAGLLSSIGESANCIKPSVRKIPYTIDAVNYSFDITTQQPHLFVTPSFQHLCDVLEEFADRMAFRKGGTYALEVAARSNHTGTVELSSGIQASGVVKRVILDDTGEAVYFGMEGPVQLCAGGIQLDGHGKDYHAHGFSSPVGHWAGISKDPALLSDQELQEIGIISGNKVVLYLASGVVVEGVVSGLTRHPQTGLLMLVAFDQAMVKYRNETLFDPSWGTYDMAVGATVVSAWSGPADPIAYDLHFEAPSEKTHKITYTDHQKKLHELYARVRKIREERKGDEQLGAIFSQLKSDHPKDWLLSLEIVEILQSSGSDPALLVTVEGYLIEKCSGDAEIARLISDGLSLVHDNFELVH